MCAPVAADRLSPVAGGRVTLWRKENVVGVSVHKRKTPSDTPRARTANEMVATTAPPATRKPASTGLRRCRSRQCSLHLSNATGAHISSCSPVGHPLVQCWSEHAPVHIAKQLGRATEHDAVNSRPSCVALLASRQQSETVLRSSLSHLQMPAPTRALRRGSVRSQPAKKWTA